jgi:hypothetical protein
MIGLEKHRRHGHQAFRSRMLLVLKIHGRFHLLQNPFWHHHDNIQDSLSDPLPEKVYPFSAIVSVCLIPNAGMAAEIIASGCGSDHRGVRPTRPSPQDRLFWRCFPQAQLGHVPFHRRLPDSPILPPAAQASPHQPSNPLT